MMSCDVVIVGAGPAGLAAAIAARRAGLSIAVIEKVALVNSLLHYPTDMVFFTTPELLEIGGFPFVSPYEKPTRQEALRYYRRVTDACQLEIAFDTDVTGLARRPDGVFVVTSTGAQVAAREWHGRAVVIATGAYDVPNLLGIPGEDLPHVAVVELIRRGDVDDGDPVVVEQVVEGRVGGPDAELSGAGGAALG